MFTLQELQELINVDYELSNSIFKNLLIKDFPNCKWNQQELALRIGDDSLYDKCYDHIVQSPQTDLFQFIYKYFDGEFSYNCLQILQCYSCYTHTEYNETLSLWNPNDHPPNLKVFPFVLSKVYNITSLNIEVKDDSEQYIKGFVIHISSLCNQKELKTIETIPYTNNFKPALRTQAFGIEILYNESYYNLACSCGRRELGERKACQKCFPSFISNVTIFCYPDIELLDYPLESEEDVLIIQKIINQQLTIRHQLQAKLQESCNIVYEQYKGIKNDKLNVVAQMTDYYKAFNQASLIVEKYSERVWQFYGFEMKEQKSTFTDCVECSRRLLQNANNVSEELLRKIYFSPKLTHYERDTPIRLLEPTLKYEPIMLEEQHDEEWYKEFLLQGQLQIKNDHILIDFICKWLPASFKKQANNPYLNQFMNSLVNQLLIYQSHAGVDCIKQVIGQTMLVESICYDVNMLNILFTCQEVQTLSLISEITVKISRNAELLGAQILFGVIREADNQQYLATFDLIYTENTKIQIIEFLSGYIVEYHNSCSSQKLVKCFQIIQKCWSGCNNLMKYFIQLDSIYHKICDQQLDNAYIDEIYNSLYLSIEIDNSELQKYLMSQLLSDQINKKSLQRYVTMLHKIIFTKTEFRIELIPNPLTEESLSGLHKNTHIECMSTDVETFDDLRQKLIQQKISDWDCDFIVHNNIIDDPFKTIELVYKNFYILQDTKRTDRFSYAYSRHFDTYIVRKSKLLNQLPLMTIQYSLRGVGGHDNLQNIPPIEDTQKMEIQRNLLPVFEQNSLRALFGILNELINQGNRFMTTIQKAIQILHYLSNQQSIKQLILSFNGIVILFKIYMKDPQEKLLQFMDDLLLDTGNPQLKRKLSETTILSQIQYYDSESEYNLLMILKYLENTHDDRIRNIIYQIIPLIVRDIEQPVDTLINHFINSISFKELNEQLTIFSEIIYNIPKQYSYFRKQTIKLNIFQKALEQCCSSLEYSLQSLKIVLSVSKTIEQAQINLIELGLLSQIYQLSMNTSELKKSYSEVCKNFISYVLQEDQYVIESLQREIQQLDTARQQDLKKVNQQKRQKFQQRFQKSNLYQKMQQIQEEPGLQCLTCKEGYSMNSSQLGVYIQCLSFMIPDEKIFFQSAGLQVQEISGVQSITNFRVIHWGCHRKNFEIINRNQSKEELPIRSSEEIEWEAANKINLAQCNNYFPIKGQAQVDLEIYIKRCERLFKCKINSRQWIVFNDLKGLVIKMSKLQKLSNDSDCGSYHNNVKLIPLFIMAVLQNDVSQYQALHQVQLQNMEQYHVILISSLFFSNQEWLNIKQKLLQYAKSDLNLLRAFLLISIIHQQIFSKMELNQSMPYQKQLDQYLIKDLQNVILYLIILLKILISFEKMQEQYQQQAKSLQIEDYEKIG